LAYYPPRFNAVDQNMSPFTLRNDLTTVGAYDSIGAPSLSTITVTPNPANVINGNTIQLTATGTYTDSSTINVTASCTWTNGGSTAFHLDAVIPGLVDTDAVGSGTATCTIGSISGNATVNVAAPPPHRPLQGPFKVGGKMKVVIH
jgi:hypothetical protein